MYKYQLQFIKEKTEWKKLLSNKGITDVYYQYEYVSPISNHLNGVPVLIHYGNDDSGFIYAIIIQDIALDQKFQGVIPKGIFYDAESPYGYGGPIFYGDFEVTEAITADFQSNLKKLCREEGLITQFIRFYPLLFEKRSAIIADRMGTYKSTIYMDTSDKDRVTAQLDSQYRRKIRKATEAGVKIVTDQGERIDEFIRLYHATMEMHQADDFYFFPKEYYEYLIRNFKDHLILFYAYLDDKVVGASLYLYDQKYMHFHLGGRDVHAPNVPFENLIMVEAAKWANEHGMQKLHLGGGLSEQDSLFGYKKKFNRAGMLPFYIGRSIFDEEKYAQLMRVRAETDSGFCEDNAFYIQYRY